MNGSGGISDFEQSERLFERSHGVAEGCVFVGDEALVAEVGDGFGDPFVMHFLGVVHFVAAGIAGGVEMGEEGVVVADGADDIAFHDLHVIDVVEELHAGGFDAFAEFDTPGGAVALVVGVVDLAVEELHAEGDVLVFGLLDDFADEGDAVVHAFGVGELAAVAGEEDDVGGSGFGGGGDVGADLGFDGGVIFFMIDVVGEFAAASDHGGDEAVFLEDGEVFGADEVEAGNAHFGGFAGHFVQGEFVAAAEDAAGDGLFEASFAGGGGGGRSRGKGEGGEQQMAALHGQYGNREERLWALRCG